MIQNVVPNPESADQLASIIVSGGFNLDILMGLAGVFLGLSVAVQAIQEIYKFLTTSKARAYRKALRDFLEESTGKEFERLDIKSMKVRGPFQPMKRQKPTHLLPMNRENLLRAVQKTAPDNVKRGIDVLTHEARVQKGIPRPPSPLLRQWIRELWTQVSNDGCARELFEQLEGWELVSRPPAAPAESSADEQNPEVEVTRTDVDAVSLLEGVKEKFLPSEKVVAEGYEQFANNFDHAYRRRNLRQTVVFAFLLALALNLPLSGLYQHASSLSPEELAAVVNSAVELYSAGLIQSESEKKEEPSGNTPQDDPKNEKEVNTEKPPETPPKEEQGATGESAAQEPTPISSGEASPVEADPSNQGDEAQLDDPTVAIAEQKSKKSSDQPAEATAEETGDQPLMTKLTALVNQLDEAAKVSVQIRQDDTPPFQAGWKTFETLWDKDRKGEISYHLLQCFFTALLVAFGAPFWHRLSTALLGMRKPAPTQTQGASREGEGS